MCQSIRPRPYVQPGMPTIAGVSARWPELGGFGVYLQLFAERAVACRSRGDWVRYNLLVDRWQQFQDFAMSTCR